MMTQVIIQDETPRTQLIAAAAQTVFNTNWTADVATDIDVYARADGVEADDVTQLVSPSLYNVTFIGASETVRVTFLSGRTADDIITIVRNTPAERLNLYINTNFTPSMLNQDFGILTLVDQQNQMYDTVVNPGYNVSETIDPIIDRILPILEANQIWAMNPTRTGFIAYNVPSGGGIAPDDATYILQVADAELPNAQAMGALASGIVVNTTTTGVQLTRILTGTTDQISIADGSGISGNPTVSIASNPILPGTGSFIPPKGSTAQRPVVGVDGMVRYNTTSQSLEVFEGVTWDSLAGGIVDSVVGTANQIDVDNTDTQNPILSLSSTLDAPGTFTIQGTIALDGIIDDDTFATATATNIPTAESVKAYVDSFGPGTVTGVNGTTNEIDIDNTDPAEPIVGIASNPILPGNAGVTLPKGTVAQRAGASGTMRFNTDASVFEVTLDGASWVTLDTHTAGDVDSIIGTANQIIASSPTGNVTLSLPQDIGTSSNVHFNSIRLDSSSAILDANGNVMMSFNSIASAVNYLSFANNAIGGAVFIAAGGSDSNINLNVTAKGTGVVSIVGAEGGTSPITIFNGTSSQHSTTFAFANTAAGRTVTFPDANGTILMTGQAINTVPSIAFSTTSGVIGTTTNDSAAAGSVGEITESEVLVASAVAVTSGNAANVTSISLEAGDYDVWGNMATNPQAGVTTTSLVSAWVNTVSASSPTNPGKGSKFTLQGIAAPAGGGLILPTGARRITIAATTTVYLSGVVTFAAGTMSIYGYIMARRRR